MPVFRGLKLGVKRSCLKVFQKRSKRKKVELKNFKMLMDIFTLTETRCKQDFVNQFPRLHKHIIFKIITLVSIAFKVFLLQKYQLVIVKFSQMTHAFWKSFTKHNFLKYAKIMIVSFFFCFIYANLH